MKVLVTGASGFVGSHLVEELISKKYKVRVLLRKQSNAKNIEGLNVERVYADYNNIKSLCKAIDGISIIYHVAGVTKACKKSDYFEGNARSTKNLLEAAASLKTKPKRFLLVSSLAAAGPAIDLHHPKSENDLCKPIETYGRSKLSAELLALNYIDRIPVTIVRPPTVYGSRDVDCFELFNQADKHINLFFGNSKKYISIIHVIAHD